MRLVSWNVNGIRAVQRKELFEPMMTSLQPDVVCLQETKADREQANCELEGFGDFWHPAAKKGYSGTAIFSKPAPLKVTVGLPARIVKKYDFHLDAYGNPNDEGRVITAEYNDFFLVTSYTPNVKGDLTRLVLRHEQWDPAFLEHLVALKKKKPVAVCGDLNVAHQDDDLANPKENRGKAGYTTEEREGIQKILDAGFVDTFRIFTQGNGYYTWWSNFSGARQRNVGWRIDYFLASQSLTNRITAAEIHPELMGSDHCPVSLTLDL